MPEKAFEIRICSSCGLRYPRPDGQELGLRCPVCLGETRLALRRQLARESEPSLQRTSPPTGRKLSVLLDNVRSAWNAGSILRSADGFGFGQAYFCGITPTPDHEAVIKTSLGAQDSVPWSYHKDAVKLARGLQKTGYDLYALEEDPRALTLDAAPALPHDSVLVVGNEISGVDPELLDLCDGIFYIPMRGEKKSFNVAIAFGIAAHTLSRK